MKNDIQSILEDLYMIDPTFKESEVDLKKLIENLIKAKPDLKIDEQFVESLRQQLQEEAIDLVTLPTQSSGYLANLLKRFIFPFTGGVLATVLVVTIVGSRLPLQPMNQDMFGGAEEMQEASSFMQAESMPRLKTIQAPDFVEEAAMATTMSDDYLENNGLDLNLYGNPVIQNEWEEEGEKYALISYLLMINNETLLDENGDPIELTVRVNLDRGTASSPSFSNISEPKE